MRAVLSGAAAPSPRHIKQLALASALLALPSLATAGTGALDRIKAAKTITIAYAPNAYPISFRDADGAPRGYSVDLCRRVVASVQRALGLDALEIAWIEGNTPRRLAAVANGEADIECGTTTMTLGRQRQRGLLQRGLRRVRRHPGGVRFRHSRPCRPGRQKARSDPRDDHRATPAASA